MAYSPTPKSLYDPNKPKPVKKRQKGVGPINDSTVGRKPISPFTTPVGNDRPAFGPSPIASTVSPGAAGANAMRFAAAPSSSMPPGGGGQRTAMASGGGGQTDAWDGFAKRYATDPALSGAIWQDPGIVTRDYLAEQGYDRMSPLAGLMSESAGRYAPLFAVIHGRDPASSQELDEFINFVADQTAAGSTPGGRTFDTDYLLDQVLRSPDGSLLNDFMTKDPTTGRALSPEAQQQSLAGLMEVATMNLSPYAQRAIAGDLAGIQTQYNDGMTKGAAFKGSKMNYNDFVRTYGSSYYT